MPMPTEPGPGGPHLQRQLPLLREADDRPAVEPLVVEHLLVPEVPGPAHGNLRRLLPRLRSHERDQRETSEPNQHVESGRST